jgi:hypothetical protein
MVMKKVILFVVILFNSSIFSQTLLETIDLPVGDFWNSAYGLVHNNSKYWISSSHFQDGVGNFRAVNETGVQVDQVIINYPTIRASQGLAFDGTNFWYVERKTARGDLFKIAPDGTVLDSIFTASLGGPFYLGGAAWDGTGLWISVYYPDNQAALYKVDVSSKTIVDTISTFGLQPTGITVKGDTLFYVNDGFNSNGSQGYDRIYAVNLVTKDTLFSFELPHPTNLQNSPKGLAWDGTNFWLLAEPVGGTGRQLFRYDLGGSGTPQIFVPITSVIFPNTTVGYDTSAVIQIFNNGNAVLTVDSINLSGNVFSMDTVSFPLQILPGNSENITVNFTPQDYFYYQGNLNIYSNDPVDPIVQVSLAGQGVFSGPVITLLPTSLNFGDVWIGEDGVANRKFKIINKGDQSLDIAGMQFNLPEFTFDSPSIPFQLASTDTQEVTVYFYPTDAVMYDDTLKILNNDPGNPIATVTVTGNGTFSAYNSGYTFWNYNVPPNPYSNTDVKVEGLKPINDITGDGIDEVIIATDNYWLICLNGAGAGMTYPVWSFNSYISNTNAGSIGQSWELGVQDAIQIANDLNGDGMNDVVIGTGGSGEHVYAIDGTNGEVIWEFGDNVNYSLGDFEAVDVQRDFNNDNVEDVLAIADGNQAGTGYKSAYLFDGTNGNIIWQYPYPGPNLSFGKSIISIDDVTGDNIPDAVIAVGNNGSTDLKVIGLNGTSGTHLWDTEMIDYEPKELLELPLPGDSSDVIAAEYFGQIHRLNGRTGDNVWTYPLGGLAGVIQMGLIEDLNSDSVPDVLIASFAANGLNCLSGADGTQIWAYPMDFQYGVAVVPDINFDGADDVITGDQTGTFFCLSGKGDSVLFTHTFSGDKMNSVNVMPSIDGNYSFELLAGTREGKVACFSGGVDTTTTGMVLSEEIPTEFNLYQNYPNPFNPTTKIEFKIPEAGLVNLKIYDILGREVITLLNEAMQPGNYKVDFDASTLTSGIYFYRLQAGNFVETKKMLLLK